MNNVDESFVTVEKASVEGSLPRLYAKLFRRLDLFWRLFPFTVITILLASAAPALFRWYSAKVAEGAVSGPLGSVSIPFTLSGLVVLTALAAFFRIAAWVFFEIAGLWSSRSIHDEMIVGLSGTRTTFFDENPSGRILNRLVSDFNEMSSTAIIFVGDSINALVEILSILVVASVATPWAPVFGVPLFGAFYFIQRYRAHHLDRARSHAAVAVSSLYGRQADLIEGREVFRLYGRTDELLRRMRASIREYVRTGLVATAVEVRATFAIQIASEVFSFLVLLGLIAALRTGHVTFAFAGVILSSLFGLSGSIRWLDLAAGRVTSALPNLRRVMEFVELPSEESQEFVQGYRGPPATARPPESIIRFDRLQVSYRPGSPVILHGLDVAIARGEKVALVGRTGSGKSSVFQALLRMVAVHSGDLRIDGRSAYAEPIVDYRQRFGIVPQVPYLFAGTVRTALDRNEERNDVELRSALDRLGIAFALDHPVSEGGKNFSLGERQLLCLARVIAHGKEIILMDEPTSGLDPVTDARITASLRTAFRDCTVLTIAHRKESLLSYDRVIELGFGKVVWEGNPVDWLGKLH